MSKKSLKPIVNSIAKSLKKYSPEILTALGITGMLTTTIMAVKATPKALDVINDLKDQHVDDEDKKAYATDFVKKVVPLYIPSAVTCVSSMACLIGASSVHHKRNAVLATACKISETAFTEYRDKVVSVIGDKKERAVRDEIAKDHVEKHPVKNTEVFITEKGNTLCYDELSGRYFKSDIDKINRIVNELNCRMMDEMYISLNDFYYELGLEGTGIGEELGWSMSRGLIDVILSAQLTDDGPCVVVDYRIPPKYNFKVLY